MNDYKHNSHFTIDYLQNDFITNKSLLLEKKNNKVEGGGGLYVLTNSILVPGIYNTCNYSLEKTLLLNSVTTIKKLNQYGIQIKVG